jgi:hypothetical protein
MSERFIVCVLANDAETNKDTLLPRYVDIGDNSKRRIDDAVAWLQKSVGGRKVTWMFGAGTDVKCKLGPTLATFQRQYLLQKLPNSDVIFNEDLWKYYGTLEEIDWVIKNAKRRYPNEVLKFVFCTQAGHIDRVRYIMSEFYPGVECLLVTTGHLPGFHVRWWQEIRSHIKLRLIRKGKAKRRWQM